MSDDYVTRVEFDALADEVRGQGRTNRVILRELGEVKVTLAEHGRLLRRLSRHLGVDTNGD